MKLSTHTLVVEDQKFLVSSDHEIHFQWTHAYGADVLEITALWKSQ